MLLKICPFCQLEFDEDKIKFHIGVQHLGIHPEAEELDEVENESPIENKTNEIEEAKLEVKSTYDCEICSKSLSSAHGLEGHMQLVHQSKRLPCDFCGKQVIEARHQNHLIHCEIVHYKKYSGHPFQCDKCKRSFSRKSHLSEHQNIHLKIKDKFDAKSGHDCEICSKSLTNYLELVLHMEKVHQSQRLPCEFCGKQVITAMLQKHLDQCQINYHEKFSGHPFQCQKCKRSFTKKKNLIRHQKLLHLKPRFSCEFCKQIFAKKSTKNAHVSMYHSFKGQPLPLRMPNVIMKRISKEVVEKWQKKTFIKPRIRRIATVPDPSNFCSFCQVSFKTKVSFERHQNIINHK